MQRYLAFPFLAFLLLAFLWPSGSWAVDSMVMLEQIRLGEGAVTYAAGGIMESVPQAGIVNVITGDNQTVGNRMLLGRNDTLYLKLMSSTDVAPGDLFTIYRRVRKVFHPMNRRYMGQLVIRSAVVQAVQVDPDLITVKVVRAYASVSPGDPVMKFEESIHETTVSEVLAADGLEGMVVDLQSDKAMTLVAQWNVVYLDRGREDGIRAGDRLEVVRVGGNLPRRTVGELKVLSTDERTATALIVRSTSRILTGDRVKLKGVGAAGPIPVMAQVPAPAKESLVSRPERDASGQTKITLSDLANQLQYESGEITIKPEGYRALDQVVEYLKKSGDEKLVRVEGHADSVEIGPSLKRRYPSNWELSKARASEVVRYLIEKGGIDSAKLSSVGFGDTKPIASNLSEEGRQKNRRVDILLYGPEPADSHATPINDLQAAPDGGFSFSHLERQGTDPASVADTPPANPATNPAADPAADSAADPPPPADESSVSAPDVEPSIPAEVSKE